MILLEPGPDGNQDYSCEKEANNKWNLIEITKDNVTKDTQSRIEK